MVFSQKNRYPNGIKAVIVADDQLLVDPADASHYELQRLNMCWKTALGFECVLIYTTEKTMPEFLNWSKDNPIQRPDILISSSGTEVYIMDKGEKLYQPWRARILEGFDKATSKLTIVTEFPWQLKPKPISEQRTHVLKYDLHETIQPNSGGYKGFSGMLTRRLLKRQCKAQVCHQGGLDVTILPECAGLGNAVAFVLSELEKCYSKPSACTIVCAECSSGGAKLFALPMTYPTMVQGASAHQREYFETLGSDITKYHSRLPLSAGLIDSLQEFELLPRLALCEGACHNHGAIEKTEVATTSEEETSILCSFQSPDFFSSAPAVEDKVESKVENKVKNKEATKAEQKQESAEKKEEDSGCILM
mmetsp:Transcript_45308/g.75578  ORF Transcript_45308/g.75578 Transcript_45308/m.75578 type:complete len:363 (-) Transcript_45308:41-1129(-)